MGGVGNAVPSLGKLKAMASGLGKAAVLPAVKNILRNQIVTILQDEDPDQLRKYIYVDYPLVRNKLPPKYVDVLQNLGPQYEDEIKAMVHPEQILLWLDNPEEWMDVEQNPQAAAKVKKCAEIIRETDGGEEWLAQQTIHLYQIAGIV